jgi:(p)ppGpp synthase/HD superfamily hydrolase
MSNNQELDNLLLEAIRFATAKHFGQKRLDGTPYIKHPAAVAELVGNNLKAEIVAILHDTIEDTNTTFEELKTKFGRDIAVAVYLVTKPKGMDYEDYINIIKKSEDKLAIAVKIADLKHNLATIDNIPDIKKRERLKKRYTKALEVLTQ